MVLRLEEQQEPSHSLCFVGHGSFGATVGRFPLILFSFVLFLLTLFRVAVFCREKPAAYPLRSIVLLARRVTKWMLLRHDRFQAALEAWALWYDEVLSFEFFLHSVTQGVLFHILMFPSWTYER